MRYDTKVYTQSGTFQPLSPRTEDVRAKDIAQSLGNIARWGGRTPAFYSVAEHSVAVAKACPPELAIYGLLHDAAEAYLGDIPAPLKDGLVFEVETETGYETWDFNDIEFAVLETIFRALGVPVCALPDCVIDRDIAQRDWEEQNVLTGKVRGANPDDAGTLFLCELDRLTKGIVA